MKIGIIGSGGAGMAAAWALSNGDDDLTVIEAAEVLGGHATSIDVPCNVGGKQVNVPVNPAYDIFCPQTYPSLSRLLEELKIETEFREFSYTYESLSPADDGNVDWTVRMPTLLSVRNLAQLRHRRYRAFVKTSVALGRHIDAFLKDPTPGLTYAELLVDGGVPADLVGCFFLPAFARPWGMKPSDMAQMPAELIARWIQSHRTLTPRPLPWRQTVGGVGAYAARLTEALGRRGVEFMVSSPVEAVTPTASGTVEVRISGAVHTFDEVILATNARQALALLTKPDPAVRSVLEAFSYQKNQVVVHSDRRLAPVRRKDWSYFNVRYNPATDETYNSIWFGKDQGAEVWATNFRQLPLEPRSVHATFDFEQPIFTNASEKARADLGPLQGSQGIWFCGVYAHGSGHHEDALVSASQVAAQLHKAAAHRRRVAS